MRYLFTIILISKFTLSNAQRTGEYYNTVASNAHYRFKVINDSLVELGNIPTHMSRNCTSKFIYATTKKGIIIFTDNPFSQDSSSSYNCKFKFVNSEVNLIKIDNGFVNEKDSLIYVRDRDYYANHRLLILLNGKKFTIDLGKTNGYGIITKSPKHNRRLANQLKMFESDFDKYTFQSYSGYEAFQRFGFKNVYGVWVINSK